MRDNASRAEKPTDAAVPHPDWLLRAEIAHARLSGGGGGE